jgi:AcrR family transcriptional regulator
MPTPKVDQRREAGSRTRARLMDAALDLLAERGEDSVSLRDLTGAAGANVSAVSYHFGSLKSLCDAAIEDALERYLDAQHVAVADLSPDSTLEDLAEAFARPMISALASGGRNLAVMRLVARAGIDPPDGWRRFDAVFDQIRADSLRVLKRNVSRANAGDLILRTRMVAGMLNWMVLSPLGTDLRGRSRRQLERLVIPTLAGAFGGPGSGSKART